MKKLIVVLILQLMANLTNAQLKPCVDFNDGSVHGWLSNTDWTYNHLGANVSIQNGGPAGATDKYLSGGDETGQSFMYNITDYKGDWTKNNCKTFCWDFRVFNDGSAGTINITPSVAIFEGYNPSANWGPGNPPYYATFVAATTVTEHSPWQHICAPIALCSSGNMPSNSSGSWKIYNNTGASPVPGTCADWSALLTNVQGIKFGVDYTNESQDEVTGFDNICLTDCGGNNEDKCCSNFYKHVVATIPPPNYNTLNVSFSAGPNAIKKITADIVDFSVSYNDPSTNGPNSGSICSPCVPNSDQWGNFAVANPNAISVFGLPGKPSVPAGSTSIYSREIVWGSTYGPGINMTSPCPAISIPLSLPPKNPSSCCSDTMKFCIRYKFTDVNCVTCDTLVCYKIVRKGGLIIGLPSDNEGIPPSKINPGEPLKKEEEHKFNAPGAKAGKK